MNAKGFILIEVLLGTLIAGMIFASLTTILYQVSRGNVRADSTISYYSRISLVRYQLTRDLVGAMIPAQADVIAQLKEDQKKGAQKKPAFGAPKEQQSQPQQQPEKKEKKQKPIDTIFHAVAQENQQKLITFITSNPMQTYWSERAGKPKPRVARVVYRLVPDEQKPDSFNLMRQEGDSLDFGMYQGEEQKVRSFELINGIRSMDFSCVYVLMPEHKEQPKQQPGQKQPAQEQKQEPQKIEFQESATWVINPLKERQKERKPVLPNMVKFTFELWDDTFEKTRTFSFVAPISSSEQQQIKQAMVPFAQPKAKQPEPAKQPPKLAMKRQQRMQQSRPPLMIGVRTNIQPQPRVAA